MPGRRGLNIQALHQVLIAGRQAERDGQPVSYYVHPGDVNWWLFYINQDDDLNETLRVWRGEDGGVQGWSLLSPQAAAFDVFVHPTLRGTARAAEIWAWAEARLCALLRARRPEVTHVRTMWVAEDDDVLNDMLRSRGFEVDPSLSLRVLERSLAEPVADFTVPPGFEVRPLRGAAEAETRALASRAAFRSTRSEAEYVARYRRFMATAAYAEAVDLVAVNRGADDEPRVAAFALLWTDSVNALGLFEPVGTHPDFQRRGLGRAVLLAGLRRMQAAGLTSARLCVEHDNTAAALLYESAGFRLVRRITTYARRISQ